jgi:hypothetical protein
MRTGGDVMDVLPTRRTVRVAMNTRAVGRLCRDSGRSLLIRIPCSAAKLVVIAIGSAAAPGVGFVIADRPGLPKPAGLRRLLRSDRR